MWMILVLAALLDPYSPAAAFKAGAEPGYTGGFGERNCRECHFDQGLNNPRGSMRIQGLPKSYTPGRGYAISVQIKHPELKSGGFQLTIRVAEGPRAGSPAGTIQPGDDRVQIVRSTGSLLQYAQHTEKGSIPQDRGSIVWNLRWTAPAEPGQPIVCHAAGNAGNDDQSPLGDMIYATRAVIR